MTTLRFWLAVVAALLSSASSLVTLYGAQSTRSPLVNWYLLEKQIPFTQASPRPSKHPFGQTPFLTDSEGGVEVFESGAILLYLADKYGAPGSTAAQRAAYTKWVVWANSELDGLCFGKGMSGTQLDKVRLVRARVVMFGFRGLLAQSVGCQVVVSGCHVGIWE